MQHYGRKTAQAGAHNTGRAANVSGSPSTSSRPHPTTRPVSSQSPHKHVRHNTKVPTAKDRPHLRDNCVYLGDVPCGTLQDGVFTRSFDSTRNTLLWELTYPIASIYCAFSSARAPIRCTPMTRPPATDTLSR